MPLKLESVVTAGGFQHLKPVLEGGGSDNFATFVPERRWREGGVGELS
jgi:hypothetical protein